MTANTNNLLRGGNVIDLKFIGFQCIFHMYSFSHAYIWIFASGS